MTVFKRIYKVVSKIPKGKVTTYKNVAVKSLTTPRVVGFALHCNKDPKNIPCHRVVKSDRTLAKGYLFGGKEEQARLLKKERIVFDKENKILRSFFTS